MALILHRYPYSAGSPIRVGYTINALGGQCGYWPASGLLWDEDLPGTLEFPAHLTFTLLANP